MQDFIEKTTRADGPISAEEAARVFRENFAEAQYHFVEFFSDHLAACSRAFGGDLQKPLILALVGQTYLAAMRRSDGSQTAAGINASSIAEITAIPRQTVNRKLRALASKGYIVRRFDRWELNVDGGNSVAGRLLEGLTRSQVETVSRFVAGFDRIRSRQP